MSTYISLSAILASFQYDYVEKPIENFFYLNFEIGTTSIQEGRGL